MVPLSPSLMEPLRCGSTASVVPGTGSVLWARIALFRDEVRSIVDNVFSFLQSNPRTSVNAKYLVWPVIFAFLSGSDKIFDSLEFRDRCALRMASTWAICPSSNSARNLDGKRWIKSFEHEQT